MGSSVVLGDLKGEEGSSWPVDGVGDGGGGWEMSQPYPGRLELVGYKP